MAEGKLPGGLVAIVAVALCCALPTLVVLGGGLVATTWGTAIRFWPITFAGAALVIFGGMSLGRSRTRHRLRGDRVLRAVLVGMLREADS